MCSQYSAAEFPQRGDNPGTWQTARPDSPRRAAPLTGPRLLVHRL
jgi:hypothetical protein